MAGALRGNAEKVAVRNTLQVGAGTRTLRVEADIRILLLEAGSRRLEVTVPSTRQAEAGMCRSREDLERLKFSAVDKQYTVQAEERTQHVLALFPYNKRTCYSPA